MHTFIHKVIPSVLLYCKIHDFIRWFDHFAVRIRISNAVVN